MKSDSELLNELAQKTNYLHEMSAEESRSLKSELLSMYKDISALCKKEGLTVMLCGGSALGAIRHQGFIPWDDDLDLLMPRADYEHLIQLIKDGYLGEKYEYNTPNPNTDCKNVFLKIYRKSSLDVDIYSADAPFPKGISLDVFALDAVPHTRVGQQLKGLIANGLQFASIVTLYAQYPSKKLKEFMSLDPDTRKRYRMKVALGKLFGIIPHRKWVWWFDCFVRDERTDKPLGIPTGRKYYAGEIFPREVYLPTTEAIFEGIKVQIPGQYDPYLRNLYHDYMQLPPIEKRERHFICQFQAPDDKKQN